MGAVFDMASNIFTPGVTMFMPALSACGHRGLTCLADPTLWKSGPLAGFNWIYFRAPWGFGLEVASFDKVGYESNSPDRLWSAKPA